MGLRYRNMNLQRVTANIPDALSVDILQMYNHTCHVICAGLHSGWQLDWDSERESRFRASKVACEATVMRSDVSCEATVHVKRRVMWSDACMWSYMSCDYEQSLCSDSHVKAPAAESLTGDCKQSLCLRTRRSESAGRSDFMRTFTFRCVYIHMSLCVYV